MTDGSTLQGLTLTVEAERKDLLQNIDSKGFAAIHGEVDHEKFLLPAVQLLAQIHKFYNEKN